MSEPGAPDGDDRENRSLTASLRVRNYRLYAVGQTVSVLGTWMQNIAIAWYTLEISQNGAILGLVTAIRWLPVLVLGPWAGLVADRSDKQRMFLVTQTALAVISVGVAILSVTGNLPLGGLVVAVLAVGIVGAFDTPSRQALISELVPAALLTNAVGLNSATTNIAKLAGPGLAGVVIAAFGVTPCFVINAISFLAVILSLLRMGRSELFRALPAHRGKGQIRAGLGYVMRSAELRPTMLMVLATGIFTAEFPVTVPLMTTTTFDSAADGYGTAMAVMGVGAVAGGIIVAHQRRPSVRSIAVSAIQWGAVIIVAALAPTFAVLLISLALVGVGTVTFNSAAKTLLQLRSDPAFRGRVMSLWAIAWQGGTVVGAPLVGFVGSWLGPRYGMLIGAVTALAVGLLALLPRHRDADPGERGDPA
ncbi:MFS transporter [Nakamurella lactea]|uniref:MFS transporter n=1 Tax=Nakamurella lactea TaxID=459515 RepID=UPI00040510B3|nr:MFS transporter [Nakamurella lactea]